jgi:hypothetical protein
MFSKDALIISPVLPLSRFPNEDTAFESYTEERLLYWVRRQMPRQAPR